MSRTPATAVSATPPVVAHAADQVVAEARAVRAALVAGEVRVLELAVQWARLHPVPEGGSPATWEQSGLYAETTAPLAGPGTPSVAEFAPLELSAALGLSHDAARALIADALDLTCRLPRLWALAQAGRVAVWRARRIAVETRDLSVVAADYADRLVCAVPDKVDRVDARALIEEARLYHDPDRAAEEERHQLTHRGVWLHRGTRPATTDVVMTMDTPDALAFDATVADLAGTLGRLGDTDTLDIRRARAAGLLASPQTALDLLTGNTTHLDGIAAAGLGSVELFVHVTPADLAAHTRGGVGAATVEKLGPATTGVIGDWVRRVTGRDGPIRIRPVLTVPVDTCSPQRTVDAHDPPESMRQAVVLRDSTCVFPACGRDSRRADLDHIAPYLPRAFDGPPGQTNAANLAPLCRTHHRAKTFTRWRYERLPDGTYEWTSPTGHTYLTQGHDRRPPDPPDLLQL